MKKIRENLDYIVLGIVVILFCWTFLFIWNQFVQSNKENQQTSQWITNTVSVVGEWKSYVMPDELVINLSVSEKWQTTKQAQDLANAKILKIKEILATFNVAKENVQTISVNVYPEYDRSSTKRKLLDYLSQQTLKIEVLWDNFSQKGADIIDKISAIWNVNVDSTYFDLKDKNKATQQARQKAFNDAKQKAEQLASLGWLSLWKPIMITDSNIQYMPSPVYNYAMEKSLDSVSSNGVGGTAMNSNVLSPWQTEVTVNLSVIYEIR